MACLEENSSGIRASLDSLEKNSGGIRVSSLDNLEKHLATVQVLGLEAICSVVEEQTPSHHSLLLWRLLVVGGPDRSDP
jgi:hypothetical protein